MDSASASRLCIHITCHLFPAVEVLYIRACLSVSVLFINCGSLVLLFKARARRVRFRLFVPMMNRYDASKGCTLGNVVAPDPSKCSYWESLKNLVQSNKSLQRFNYFEFYSELWADQLESLPNRYSAL